ncbi:MAG TPA: hypothetical protein ENK66_02035 [Arcobacter sp.]|jgi:homoserine kinase type II|nr:hypothetical protein [Arcobacter sp.]
MGVKTKINKKDLQSLLKIKSLQATKHGVSDSVYIINNKYILKIFENSSKKTLSEEIKLLQKLKPLQVTKLKNKIFNIKEKPALLYKKSKGKSVDNIKKIHIKQIAKFLKTFHTLTKGCKSKNKNIFSKSLLQSMVEKSNKKSFQKLYQSINIELKNDGIIHGDIFRDNVLFKKDKLKVVIDFSEACNGDFYFDLGVIALDWCKNNHQIQILLQSYGTSLTLKEFKPYIKYAGLYYILIRYFDNRDYKKLLKRIKKL